MASSVVQSGRLAWLGSPIREGTIFKLGHDFDACRRWQSFFSALWECAADNFGGNPPKSASLPPTRLGHLQALAKTQPRALSTSRISVSSFS